MATNPFEAGMSVPPPQMERPEANRNMPPTPEKKPGTVSHAREFVSALAVKFGDALEHLPDNVADKDLEVLVNKFVQDCKTGNFLKIQGSAWGQMKAQVLEGLGLAQKQENMREKIMRKEPGTSKMSKFLEKARLGIESALTI